MNPLTFKSALLAGLTLSICTPSLHAVVVTADDATADTSDPGTGVAWDNVISYGTASAVYLGGGWIISAAHNGEQDSVTIDGVSHLIDSDYTTTVTQTDDLTGSPDLQLLRLETLPDLESVTIGSLSFGDTVEMIGYGGGLSGGSNQIFGIDQDVTSNDSGTIITSAAYTLASVTMRASTDQAQAVSGDSGGGVFVYNGTTWELGGIMFGVSEDVDLGNGDVSDVTFIANLGDYATQIQAIMDAQGYLTVPEPSTTLLVGLSSLILLTKRSRQA